MSDDEIQQEGDLQMMYAVTDLMAKQDYRAALSECRKGLRLAKRQGNASLTSFFWVNEIIIQEQLGDWHGMLAAARKYLEHSPSNWSPLMNMGIAYWGLRQWKRSRRYFQQALQLLGYVDPGGHRRQLESFEEYLREHGHEKTPFIGFSRPRKPRSL